MTMAESEIGKEIARDTVSCPYCHSTDTEFFSLFGQQLLTIQYYCNICHTPFEYIKDDDVPGDVSMNSIATISRSDSRQGESLY